MSMRISTSQVYDSGIKGMQRAQSAVYKTQNQISADTRILRPSDDPVAAAQAVTVSQSKAINEQYQTNQSNAANQLAQLDTQLGSVTTALQNVRDLLVRAGNTGTMTNEDRQSIATELESKMSELLGIANSTDELGNYAFSGYQGDTLPFARDASGKVDYNGDAGERLLQVSASRQIATNVSGYDVFMDGKTGNGTFVAATAGNVVSADSRNKGAVSATSTQIDDQSAWDAAARPLELNFVDANNYEVRDSSGTLVASGAYSSPATISLSAGVTIGLAGTPVAGDRFSIDDTVNQGSATIDAGSVLNPQKWKTSSDSSNGLPLTISFSVNATTAAMEFTITDNAGNVTSAQTFTDGQAISLDTSSASGLDFGSQVVISGTPKAGDSFTIEASTTQSVFETIQSAITALQNGVNTTTYTSTQLSNDLAAQIANIDLAMENVNEVQSIVGASAKEVDELASTSADLAIQYASDLSDLVDLDYYETYSNYVKQQATLQAAQQSFTKIAGKSLFDYM